MNNQKTTGRLLVACPDRPGIVAAVTCFLRDHGANITNLDQHSTDPDSGQFFMRVEFQTSPDTGAHHTIIERFGKMIASSFGMTWRITHTAEQRRMVICVSKHDHALLELLWMRSRCELGAEVVAVVSNHPDLQQAVEGFGVDYHYVPVTPQTRQDAERQLVEIVERHDVDLIVLARYMQVLSPAIVNAHAGRIINIHHSFLPAFVGADPYQQAYDRGVKIVGATAHYVTEQLDEGPIIEQDIVRVTHRDSVEDLKTSGRILERRVLARAVQWHLQDRVILNGSKTIVFK